MAPELKIIIVGAGLGGLACAISCRRSGLEVLVLERAPQILPIGAGIQVPPNASRVINELGLLPKLIHKGTVLDGISLKRYEDGKLLITRPGGEAMIKDFGSPWIVVHRETYHRILSDEASRLGIETILSAEVISIDFNRTEVRLADNRVFQGDVIVGADGLWSTIRPIVLDYPSPPVETGDLAYRGTFTREQLLALGDARIDDLCSRNAVTCWIGPGKHCVFYPVYAGAQFNLVLIRPDNLPAGSRTAQGDIGEMRDTFRGWDEVITKIISCISTVLKWKLCHHDELKTWIKNHVALLGDSCHPTLPYQAQGAAMAVEDGAVLGELLGMLGKQCSPTNADEHIPSLLGLYESLRKSRTTLNVQGAIANQKMFHLADGTEQQARDEVLQSADWQHSSECHWADPEYQKELLGCNVVGESRSAFDKWWKQRCAGLANSHL